MRACALPLLIVAGACSRRADVVEWLRMKDQSALKAIPYAETPWFADGQVLRVPPAGTVPRDRLDVPAGPPPVDRALLERGRERFDIVCATCHGILGDGDSEVARNMPLRRPPSLHEPRIRAYPPERLVQVITLGFGLMPPFGWMLEPRDRWAIAAYVRALQLSQSVELARLPPALRAEAERELAR